MERNQVPGSAVSDVGNPDLKFTNLPHPPQAPQRMHILCVDQRAGTHLQALGLGGQLTLQYFRLQVCRGKRCTEIHG